MNTKNRVTVLAVALAFTAALSACSQPIPEPDVEPAVAAAEPAVEPAVERTQEPAAVASPEPVVAPEPEPELEPWDQEIDGVVYEGTEIAPVRIGDDKPGKAPKAEKRFEAKEGWKDFVAGEGKYYVGVGKSLNGGWIWKVFGESRFGGFRELAASYDTGTYYSTRDEARKADFVVDGRVLDRAEYILNVT